METERAGRLRKAPLPLQPAAVCDGAYNDRLMMLRYFESGPNVFSASNKNLGFKLFIRPDPIWRRSSKWRPRTA